MSKIFQVSQHKLYDSHHANNQGAPLLSMENIHFAYTQPHVPVLRGLSLRLYEGDSVAITGVSGCGKSTLLHLLALLCHPQKGTMLWKGRAIQHPSYHRLHRIGFVHQRPYLMHPLTLEENVMLPALFQGLSKKKALYKAHAMLEAVGLEQEKKRRISDLSGGQQQRGSIARALCNTPSLLIADEPTGNLDDHTSLRIIDVFKEACKQQNTSLLLATHDAVAASSMHRCYQLKNGLLYVKNIPKN